MNGNRQLEVNTEEIKRRRKELGLMSKEVAEQLGMTKQLYSHKECGISNFSDKEKVLLGDILGYSLEEVNEYLFDGALPIGVIKPKKK